MPQNKLAKEKSPYLLQHANNPVDWYPWSEEAFLKAKNEDKPVFLSIGYSTCHWCHVMEHESFEDEKVAELMNDVFVSIKVDREERPDIDNIYMAVCQMLTGSGGWPLTIIMTPDKKPFFAGTYLPKSNRYGRAGILEIIPQIKNYWLNKKDEILKSADQISSTLIKTSNIKIDEQLSEKILEQAFTDLKKRYDSKFGGFGSSPKFPTPHNLLFLLRYWKRTENSEALDMVQKTLIEMRKGGIYDHIGFGFHRYSTDEFWLVPHFEKMLYDQAFLILAYLEAYQVTKEEIFSRTAKEIIEYVIRDMTSQHGGFYSAEDADSDGKEGKFYLWDISELREILNDEADLILKIFNCEKDGNWVDPAIGGAPGTNILHMKKSWEELSQDTGLRKEELQNRVNSAREKLFKAREKRIHPHKDDKILTDWNGLMISALAKAAGVLNEKQYSDVAEKAVESIQNHLTQKNGRLLHRFRDEESGLPAYIDDYAFLIEGLLDLYETVFNIKYLKLAIQLQQIQIEQFWDYKNGGFFFTSNDSEKLLIRQKEIYDGAIPSGNSVSLINLLKLGRITGNPIYEEKAHDMIKAFSGIISNSPTAFTQFLNGLDFAFGPSKEIVIVGEKNNPESEKILNLFRGKFIPCKVLLFKDSSENELNEIAEFTKNQKMIDDKTTIYVCENYNCKMPVTDIKNLNELLK